MRNTYLEHDRIRLLTLVNAVPRALQDYIKGWEFTGRWRIVEGELYVEIRIDFRQPVVFKWRKREPVCAFLHADEIEIAPIFCPIQECAHEEVH